VQNLAKLPFLACILLACASLSARAAGQENTTSEARERWAGKSEAERHLLRRRFEEWKHLTEEERQSVRERARRLEERKRELDETATEEDRKALEALSPEERDRRLLLQALDEGRARGRSLREHLPPELVERLERADPRDRRRILDEFRRRMREEDSAATLRGLAIRLNLSREEARRLERLPLEERLKKIAELKRRFLEERIRREGLPPGMSVEAYRRLRELSPGEFLQRFRPWADRERSRRSR